MKAFLFALLLSASASAQLEKRVMGGSMAATGVQSGGQGDCGGDDGGPIVDKSSNKQIGVFSWSYGCGAARYPGVYTSTAAYLPWIQDAISS
ncbi:trypsin-like cysteine/serine peptidase domain-containing protein [Aspergillus bertholletiae]|uniref:Trypsin-like cysteine/serine peptidase domain-containing protein n=1 Tax=Aspergillus bertholletiae TaxID=1226010 RepID=A0A5N7AX18_9EURO|nr:trypsin-like cysteine/serine peptidase domain-containing protein [Aspergillus bertholletiae]